MRVEELAVTRVLDERGASDEGVAARDGGTDHHARLVPHGPWTLTGNPNQPDGLRLERLDHHDARAGPNAA